MTTTGPTTGPTISPLSTTYSEARAAFIAAAAGANGRLTHHLHPLRGPADEELAVDVAECGPHDARHVVLVVSATHGVEGFCGSALQRHWLEHHAHTCPPGVGLIMIHALNPYGFAWVRRVNEDNVDLNRNFVDWRHPPANPDYDRIAELVVPHDWSAETQQRTFAALIDLVTEVGLARMQEIISCGQFNHPTGVFYGGAEPVWSQRWLRSWAAERLAAVEQLTVIDLHTGLGEWGHGELIGSESAASASHQRAVALWGDVRSMVDGDSVSAQLSGDWLAIAGELAPNATVTAAALEYGTVDPITVLQALRADAWLHGYGDPRGPEAQAVRAQVRAAFADDEAAWLQTVWPRFAEVLRAAIAAVSGR